MLMRHVCLLACCWACCFAANAEQRGVVEFGGLAVPGAVVTATRTAASESTATDQQGVYVFPDLAEGVWAMKVEMTGFSTLQRSVNVIANGPLQTWSLEMLPLASIIGSPPVSIQSTPPPEPIEDTVDSVSKAADAMQISGSVNNGGASPFGRSQAFGNNRIGNGSLYNGNIGLTFDNSTLDARPFSLTGQAIAKPAYNTLTGLASFGGPLIIPHILPRNGPTFTLNYQWTRNHNEVTQDGLMPTADQRDGNLSAPGSATVFDPTNGKPFPGNVVPASRISSQARDLLMLYPLPNIMPDINGSAGYNYQIPAVNITHQDTWQSRINQSISRNNQVYGSFSGKDFRVDSTSLFNLLDKTDTLGINAIAGWWHAFTPRFSVNLSAQYSRLNLRVTPAFAGRMNVSGEDGILGNDQEPANWGPPTLTFASGIASLTDAQSSLTRNQTSSISNSWLWIHGRHNFTYGGDFRRQEFNLLSQENPRGSFAFTGAAAGNDFGGFLLGIPDTISIAFGNADKYFRSSAYDAFFTDDYRVSDRLTINTGLRWDYGAPIAERYARLVNLDISPGFENASPVLGNGLVHPDRRGFEPRIGISWRPPVDTSMVIRAGYGVYDNTSVYLPIMTSMAQQAPLSKSFSVPNNSASPVTLQDAFIAPPSEAINTYAVDPNLRVGYAQNWNVSLQRDLPASLVLTAAYLGSKGTRQLQQSLPNTYPAGAANPCPLCPSGFTYLESNGNSTREAAQVQLRRRLHNGFAAALQYTYSKSIDDATLGGTFNQSGPVIAQNWLDLRAERSLSNFDQRHLLTLSTQYTTGMGEGRAARLSGWRAALIKQWTFLVDVNAGSGLPETPIYFAVVNGTGVTGSIRPDYTGAPFYQGLDGRHLNPAAFTAPAIGEWGNAGRNSITGPNIFTGNASMARVFPIRGRVNFEVRLDATNILNHVTYTGWNTTVTSTQFGFPTDANAMRSVQATVRFRF